MLQVSASLLGEPDVGLLTPPEMARKASQICYAAPTLTVFADADTGTSVRLMPSMQALAHMHLGLNQSPRLRAWI